MLRTVRTEIWREYGFRFGIWKYIEMVDCRLLQLRRPKVVFLLRTCTALLLHSMLSPTDGNLAFDRFILHCWRSDLSFSAHVPHIKRVLSGFQG